MDAESRALLQLSLVPGIGPRNAARLLDRFGSATQLLAADAKRLTDEAGLRPDLAADIGNSLWAAAADKQLTLCDQRGIAWIARSDTRYPQPLRTIADPPIGLFVRGRLLPEDTLAIAIVGTRHATHYGRKQAKRLAASLSAAGITVVSGLARGIDGEAHRGTLAAGGRTLAVLAGGLDDVYPPEHVQLADQVAASGALLGEMPLGTRPRRGAFPRRNRLISGLAMGVIVVESGRRSGALITVRHAIDQNREVWAVPGPVDSRMSRGPHQLIRDGAGLVETVEDVLDQLGHLSESTVAADGRTVRHPAELQLNDTERQVLDAVGLQPTGLAEVIQRSGLPTPRVLATVSVLEIKHLIRRLSGNQVVRL